MGWTTVEVGGKAADVFEPERRNEQGQAVLHLHGHGLTTLKDNAVWSEEFERHGLPCICPHGQRCWWLDEVCREFDPEVSPLRHLRENVVPWVGQQWGASPPRIGLMGISMGGQGALQLAYRYAREFPVVAALAPAVDFQNWFGQGLPLDEMFESPEDARQRTAILQLHPLAWPKHQFLCCDPADGEWYESLERLGSKLYSTGIPFECDTETSAGGHTWEYFDTMAPRAVGFVAEHLPRA